VLRYARRRLFDHGIIVVSTDAMFLREHAGQFQAHGFAMVGKPCDFQELLRAICQALNLSAPMMAGTSSANYCRAAVPGLLGGRAVSS
jgi:hypothetical protein